MGRSLPGVRGGRGACDRWRAPSGTSRTRWGSARPGAPAGWRRARRLCGGPLAYRPAARGPGTTSGSGAPAGRARTGAPSWRGTRWDPPRDGRGGPRTVRSALVTATTLATRAERGPLGAVRAHLAARAQRAPGGGTRPPDGRRVFRARDRAGPWHRQPPARRPPVLRRELCPAAGDGRRRGRRSPGRLAPRAAGTRAKSPGRSRRAVSTRHLRRACRTSAVSRRRPRGLPGRRRSVAGAPPTEPLPRSSVVTQAP